jgi:hypothetical protein
VALALDGRAHVFQLGNTGPSERALEGLIANPDTILFSPAGQAAALIAGSTAQVLTGFPDAPSVARTFELNGARTLALSDDGTLLLAASDSAIQLFISTGEVRVLGDRPNSPVAAFVPGTHDAAVGGDGVALVLFQDLTEASIARVLSDSEASPSGLAFSADGRQLYIARSTEDPVGSIDLSSGSKSSVACKCRPTLLSRLGPVFRLNDGGPEPLWLLDLTGPEPRTVFVPAAIADQP